MRLPGEQAPTSKPAAAIPTGPSNDRPLPPVLGAGIDTRVAQLAQAREAQAAQAAQEKAAAEAQRKILIDELGGLTMNRIQVLTPAEARIIIGRYNTVLPPDIRRALNQRL
jgi:hypothetical protein